MPDLAESKETLDEAIDRAKAAGLVVVDRATVDAQGLVTQITKNLEAIASGTIEELQIRVDHWLAELDGWTVTISPITIRLTKPKGNK
jgi:hypothetical protein